MLWLIICNLKLNLMIQAKQTLGRYESVKKNNTVPKFLFYFTSFCLYGMSPIYIYRKKKVKHNHFSLYTPPPLKTIIIKLSEFLMNALKTKTNDTTRSKWTREILYMILISWYHLHIYILLLPLAVYETHLPNIFQQSISNL